MSRRRFYIPKERILNGTAVLTKDQAHHLRNVLRLRAGDEVELFDGEGQSYSGRVECLEPVIQVGALRRLGPAERPRTSFVLAAALIKPGRFEWMLQKATELGVDRVVPVETQFTSVHIPSGRLGSRLERWRRIVREASKQSGRLTLPEILSPVSFEALLASTEYANGMRLMFHEKADIRLTPGDLRAQQILLCVGPEGGWLDTEAHAAVLAGFRVVSLGPHVMRAETAALAAIAVCRYLIEKE